MKYTLRVILVWLAAAGILFPSSAGASAEVDLFNEGAMHLKMNQVDAAIDAFTRVIQLNPDNARAYMNRGEAYIMAGQYNLAIRDFAKTQQLQPGLRGLYSNVGVVWYYRKDCAKAIEYYSREIEQHPDNHIAFFNRGLCHFELEAYDRALDDMVKTLDLKPDLYWAICYKGDIFEKTHNMEQAKTAYEVALALDPKAPYARNRLADLRESSPETASSEVLDIEAPVSVGEEIVPKALVSHGPFIIEEPLSGYDEIGPEAAAREESHIEAPLIKAADEPPVVLSSQMPFIEDSVIAYDEIGPEAASSQEQHVEAQATAYGEDGPDPLTPEALHAEAPTREALKEEAHEDAFAKELYTEERVAAIRDVFPTPPAPPEAALYHIQTGAFLSRENAERQRRSLVEKRFEAMVFSKFIQGKTYHIVRVGRFSNMSDARAVLNALEEEAGINAFIQRIDN